MNKFDFLNKVADGRNDIGLSQAQVAEKLDVSEGTVSNWERGVTEIPPQKAYDLFYLIQKPELKIAYCGLCPMECCALKEAKCANPIKPIARISRFHRRTIDTMDNLADIVDDDRVSGDEEDDCVEYMKDCIRQERNYTEVRISMEKMAPHVMKRVYAELEAEEREGV